MARTALEEIVGPEIFRSAVDHYVSGAQGSELARHILWLVHPWSGMQRCHEIYTHDSDPESPRRAIELLRVVADRRALRWVEGYFDDPDDVIQIWAAGIVDQLLWAKLVEPEECTPLLARMATHPDERVRERYAFINQYLAQREGETGLEETMQLGQFFMEQLDRETNSTRRLLERVPEGKADWKPHPKSMALGYLANLVASMPSWIAMMIDRDFLDLSGYAGGPKASTGREFVQLFDKSVADARRALSNAADDHLMKMWQLRVGGKPVDEKPRYQQIADTFAHFAHHRGQLTVYLRLNNVPVPQIYGPTADEGWGS